MNEPQQVLVVVAHPDDAEIGMGMKIRSLTLKGCRIRIHCLSGGFEARLSADEAIRLRAERQSEAIRAGEILGVEAYTFGDFRESTFTECRGAINHELFNIMEGFRPDIVYTHYKDDQHIDHVVTSEVVTTVALRKARDILYFRSPYSIGFEPSLHFFGSPSLFDTKRAALSCFASQTQVDMARLSGGLAKLHYHHIHHRVLERLSPSVDELHSEQFTVGRIIER